MTDAEAPYRRVAFGPYGAHINWRADGSVLLRATEPLRPFPARFTEHLQHWAQQAPARVFLARRSPDIPDRPWSRLSYGEAFARVRQLARGLLAMGLSAERPLMILSGNDIEHALLTLAAMHVGIPVAPVSPSYALLDPLASRVAHAVSIVSPGMVFAADADAYAGAIGRAVPADVPLLFARGVMGNRHCLFLEDLASVSGDFDVDAAHARVDGDTVAKLLFTSGSTRAPKAVINTHRMLCANQQMYAQCYPLLEDTPPVLVDWLPWHHTAGGNSNLGLVLRNGGTMYIDEGRPTAQGMVETRLNLREVSPTAIYTVPKGLEMLVTGMESDDALRERVFAELRLIFAAGAAMPGSLIDRLDRLAVQTLGCRVPMTMGLGMTETAPFAVSHHRPGWRQGWIGLPAPGLELKLAPMGNKLEVRYRGPSVTPGYWRQPELCADSFDEEGFFRSGDAADFVDARDPQRGLRFAGRIAEDFKLSSGTWVNVADLRGKALAGAAPYVQDVIITGDGRDDVGMLVFLSPDLLGRSADDALRTWAQGWLDGLCAEGTGSSNRVTRALLLDEPASLARGEVTDKGSISQRAVLANRASIVELLYVEPTDPRVIRASACG